MMWYQGVIQALLALVIFELVCNALGFSPLLSLQAAVGRRRALAPSERDRLLALEDAEADRAIEAAENGDHEEADEDDASFEEVRFEDIRAGDWLVQGDSLLFVCGAPVKRGRVMVITVEAEGRHLEVVGRRGQEWAVQRAGFVEASP